MSLSVQMFCHLCIRTSSGMQLHKSTYIFRHENIRIQEFQLCATAESSVGPTALHKLTRNPKSQTPKAPNRKIPKP